MWPWMFTWLPATGSIYMDAGDGRRPSAQVLRNWLSGHPPSTGCDIFVKPIIFLNFMTEYRYQLLETKEDISKITGQVSFEKRR